MDDRLRLAAHHPRHGGIALGVVGDGVDPAVADDVEQHLGIHFASRFRDNLRVTSAPFTMIRCGPRRCRAGRSDGC